MVECVEAEEPPLLVRGCIGEVVNGAVDGFWPGLGLGCVGAVEGEGVLREGDGGGCVVVVGRESVDGVAEAAVGFLELGAVEGEADVAEVRPAVGLDELREGNDLVAAAEADVEHGNGLGEGL